MGEIKKEVEEWKSGLRTYNQRFYQNENHADYSDWIKHHSLKIPLKKITSVTKILTDLHLIQ